MGKWKRSVVIQAEANKEIAQLQANAQQQAAELNYQAALQQIEATRQANAEQQAYNKQEAELAYERNSSAGQLRQLMEAGLTEQQARQVIAAGSTGGYSAAPSVNSMQGVDYTAPANAQGSKILAGANADAAEVQAAADSRINLASTQILDFFNDLPTNILNMGFRVSEGVLMSSLGASDGGYLGNLATGSLQGQILRNINDIPAEARGSYAAFSQWASSAAAPSWAHTAQFQQAMQSASSSPMARKAVNAFFDTSNQFLTGDTYFKALANDASTKESLAKINAFKVDAEKVATDLAVIENDYKISILPDRYAAMLTSYQEQIAQMAASRDLWENENYKKAWLAEKLTNAEDAAVISKVMKMKHNGEFKYLSQDPDRAQLFAIYQLFNDAGMTDSLFGEVVASVEAYGKTALDFGVTDILKECKEWITNKKDDKSREQRRKDRANLINAILSPESPNGLPQR